MDKLDLVEYSFKHGEEIVFYDEGNDNIWVCFGGVEIYPDEHTIQFKDCSIADIEDDQEEYNGEIKSGSFDVYFNVKDEKIKEPFIPTRFVQGELMEIVRQ